MQIKLKYKMKKKLKLVTSIDKIRVFKNNIVDKSKDGKRLCINIEFGDTHRTGTSMDIGTLDDDTINNLQITLDKLVSQYNEWWVTFGDSNFVVKK